MISQIGFDHDESLAGSAPGIELDEIAGLAGKTGQTIVSCVDYCPDHIAIQQIGELDDFVARHRPEWATVRWIRVEGLSDTHVIQVLATKYDLHPHPQTPRDRRHQSNPSIQTRLASDALGDLTHARSRFVTPARAARMCE